MDMRKLHDMKNKRAELLDQAEDLLNKKDLESYKARMAEVKAMNAEIEAMEDLAAEEGRFGSGDTTAITRHEALAAKKQEEAISNAMDEARKSNEYANAFAWALKNSIPVKMVGRHEELAPLANALTIGGGSPNGSDGGFLVPMDFDNMIHRKMKEFVRLADYFNVETVTGYTGWRAVETTASRKPLPLVGENTAIGMTEQPSFQKVEYTIKKYGDRIAVSQELLDDNTAGLLQYIADWFAPRAVMTENALLLGLLADVSSKTFTAGKEISELKSVLNRTLNTAISKNAVIITNGNGYDFLDQLTDNNGRGLLVPDPTAPDVYRFKGRPVVIADADLIPSENKSSGSISEKGDYDPVYIGYFKAFGTLFRRKAMEFATTNVGGNAWANDAPELRGIVRMDAQKVDKDAAVKREIFTQDTSTMSASNRISKS